MNTKSNTKLSTDELSEREALKARLAELDKKEGKVKKEVVDEKIQLDELIPVMSLLPYNLNLTTKEYGQGSIKQFTKFGQVKKILYKDLLEILDLYPEFVTSGYFYIMNPSLVRQHGLAEAYEKILPKDKIEKLLAGDSEESVELFKSANAGQQEIFVQLLIAKVRDNPDSADLNIVDKISRISKVDIVKIATESKKEEEADEEK